MSSDEKHESIETTTTQPDITEVEERELEEAAARQAEDLRKKIEKGSKATQDLLESSGAAAKARRRRDGGGGDDEGGNDGGATA